MSRRTWRVVGWLLVTAIAVFAGRQVDWADALAATREAHLLLLGAAILLNAAILPLATAQWLLFLPAGTRLASATMFQIVAVTSTVSNGGPVMAGEATGVHLLATHGGLGHSVGFSMLLLDQVAEGLVKLTIVLLAVIVVPVALEYRVVAGVLFVGVPILFVGLTLVAHRGHVLEDMAERASGLWGRALAALHRIAGHLEALRRPKRFSAALGLGLLQKVVEALAIAAVVVAFDLTVPWWGILAVLVVVNLSTLVSVTPANLGVYEGSAFLVYSALGVGRDAAVALALVQHAVYLIPLAGIGWLVATVRPLRLRSGDSA